jgi:hypothetical protein
MLDYHPGNKEFDKIIEFYESPALVKAWAIQSRQGVTPRFLQQDWQTGYWTIMSPLAISDFINNQIHARKHPLIARLDKHLKTALADARFGVKRDLIMTRRFTTSVILHLQTILYSNVNSQELSLPRTTSHRSKNPLLPRSFLTQKLSTALKTIKTPSNFPSRKSKGSLVWFQEGQRVLAPIANFGAYAEAIVGRTLSDGIVVVQHVITGASATVSSADIQPFQSFVQGDAVELYDIGGERWLPCKILSIHPLGHANLLYIDSTGKETIIDDFPLDGIRFIY